MLYKNYYVYIMANRRNGTLYTGVTSDLIKRVWQHKNGYYHNSFTCKYGIELLVYYEHTNDAACAIEREKQIKALGRKKKMQLIEASNPDWKDLYVTLTGHK